MKKIYAGIAAVIIGAFALTGCGSSDEFNDRKEQQKAITLKGESLEKVNLAEKLRRENNPNAVRYVYLFLPGTDTGTPVGYYVIKGKVSSSGSQLGPEQEIIRAPDASRHVVDSAQDDGTFGTGDPGIFFFLADGTMVATDLIPLQSDAPLPIDVPELNPDDAK